MARPILPRTTLNAVQSQPMNPPTFILGQYQHPPSTFGVIQHGRSFTGPFQNIVGNSVVPMVAPSTQLQQPTRSPARILHADPDPTAVQQPTVLEGESRRYDTLNGDAPRSSPLTEGGNHLQPILSRQETNPVSDRQQVRCNRAPATNHQAVNTASHTIRRNHPTRGRGRGSSRARGSRSLRGRARNLLPSVLNRRARTSPYRSPPSTMNSWNPDMLSFHEMVRVNFQQQHDIMKCIRDSIVESNSRPYERDDVRNYIAHEQHTNPDNMTVLSNCLCSLVQLFILSSFVGKAPLWYLFPSDEKENDLLKLCTSFVKSQENGATLSLALEQVSVQEFLDGDTIYGRKGVLLWKRRGEIAENETRRDVSSLRIRLRRLRSRVHDDITKHALQSFFTHVPDFECLRVGVKYDYLSSNAQEKALAYCLKKQELGLDPLTNGSWKHAYHEATETIFLHTRRKLKLLYNKIGHILSLPQMNSVSMYFKNFYFQRYARSIPLLIFDSHRRNPAVVEAFIATKVRCRLADIATWVAKKKNQTHLPFFETTHCESHFIPILGDLLNLTRKQGNTPLQVKFGYGTDCERI